MKFIQLLIAVSLTAFLGCNKETGTLGEEAQTKTTAQDGSSSSMKKTIQSLWEVTSEQWEVGEQQIRAVFKDQFGDKMHGILARMKVDTLEYARQQGKTGNGVEDGRIQDSLRHAIMVEGRFSERDADRWIAKNGTAMERWVLSRRRPSRKSGRPSTRNSADTPSGRWRHAGIHDAVVSASPGKTPAVKRRIGSTN